jgi:hypothetical protein
MPGHTGADTVVVVPSARVVFAGDLVWRQMRPTLVDATTRTSVETLNSLLKQYSGYRFVPGHGAVATAADVAAFRDYVVALRAGVAAARPGISAAMRWSWAVLPELRRRLPAGRLSTPWRARTSWTSMPSWPERHACREPGQGKLPARLRIDDLVLAVGDDEVRRLPGERRLAAPVVLAPVDVWRRIRPAPLFQPSIPRDFYGKFRGFAGEGVEAAQRAATDDDVERFLFRHADPSIGRCPLVRTSCNVHSTPAHLRQPKSAAEPG